MSRTPKISPETRLGYQPQRSVRHYLHVYPDKSALIMGGASIAKPAAVELDAKGVLVLRADGTLHVYKNVAFRDSIALGDDEVLVYRAEFVGTMSASSEQNAQEAKEAAAYKEDEQAAYEAGDAETDAGIKDLLGVSTFGLENPFKVVTTK